jgi:hypothetical protein
VEDLGLQSQAGPDRSVQDVADWGFDVTGGSLWRSPFEAHRPKCRRHVVVQEFREARFPHRDGPHVGQIGSPGFFIDSVHTARNIDVNDAHLFRFVGWEESEDGISGAVTEALDDNRVGIVRPKQNVGKAQGHPALSDKRKGLIQGERNTERDVHNEICCPDAERGPIAQIGGNVPFAGPQHDKYLLCSGDRHPFQQVLAYGLGTRAPLWGRAEADGEQFFAHRQRPNPRARACGRNEPNYGNWSSFQFATCPFPVSVILGHAFVMIAAITKMIVYLLDGNLSMVGTREVKLLIRRFFDRQGIEIKRVNLPLYYVRKRPVDGAIAKNRYLEFIGPSGVGKTTLMAALKTDCFRGYLNRTDIIELRDTQDLSSTRGEAYQRLLEIKSERLWKRSTNSLQKARTVRYAAEIIVKDIAIFSSKAKQGFLLDEGLCTIFGSELLLLPDAQFAELMQGRALIYLAPRNVSTVVKRIREREDRGGHLAGHYRGLDDAVLADAVEKDLGILEHLMQRCTAHNVPFVRLFAEDRFDDNVERLKGFETELRHAPHA